LRVVLCLGPDTASALQQATLALEQGSTFFWEDVLAELLSGVAA